MEDDQSEIQELLRREMTEDQRETAWILLQRFRSLALDAAKLLDTARIDAERIELRDELVRLLGPG